MRPLAPAAAVALVVACATAAAGIAGPPAGATARCRDGHYSFSQHHSGTCSDHGGVAVWLDGSSAVGATGAIAVGGSVLLAPRKRTTDCKLGPNPDRSCSPGAYYSRLTKAVICSQSFHTGAIRNVPQSEKSAVEREYGMKARYYGSTLEIDHIVSLELGGSNNIANLFPEKALANPGYHVKDRLENRLHELVCTGTMSLRTAQIRIAGNWQRLYRSVFGKL
jgi:hypothetical protein